MKANSRPNRVEEMRKYAKCKNGLIAIRKVYLRTQARSCSIYRVKE